MIPFFVLAGLGALGLLLPAALPGLCDQLCGWERAPWLTLPGLAAALLAAGIVGLLATPRVSDPAWLWGLVVGSGLLALTLHALVTRRLER